MSSRRVPRPKGLDFFAPEIGRHGDRRDDGQIAAEEHDQPCGDVPGDGRGRGARVVGEAVGHPQPVEGRAVVGGGRGELVEHLGEAVGAGIAHGLESPAGGGKEPGGHRIMKGWTRRAIDRQLHLAGADLLAQVLGRPPHHHAGHEDADDHVEQHVDHAHALAAEDAVEPHAHHGRQGGQGVEAVCFGVDRAAGHVGGQGIEGGAGRGAEAHFFAFEVAQVLVHGQARHGRQRHRAVARPGPWRWGS